MALETLYDLYVDQLKDLHSAETQIIRALPVLVNAATTPELRMMFQNHMAETEGHIYRLDRILEDVGKSGKGKKCLAMQGLIRESEELLKEKADPDVLDAGLLAAAQRVEHYEMAAYGSVRTYAQRLGYEEAAHLLQQTLDEEGNEDHELTRLAVGRINKQAPLGNGNGHGGKLELAAPVEGEHP